MKNAKRALLLSLALLMIALPALAAGKLQTDQENLWEVKTDWSHDAFLFAKVTNVGDRDISISSVPEELLNYMDNRYVFQYSLYDYLFSHGRKNVQSAEVTDYSIDAGTRQATIHLKLSDGSSLTAVYSKDVGKYSFP